MSAVETPDAAEPKIVTFSRKSDLTLISSDGVQFRVSKSALSEASDVFESMFAIPQPAAREDSSIQLEEDSGTLELLLSWIYPSSTKHRVFSTYEQIIPLFFVARKYDVTLDAIRAMFVDPSILKSNPLGIYIFCMRTNLDPEWRAAAQEVFSNHEHHDVMDHPLTPQMRGDLRHVPFWTIRALSDACKVSWPRLNGMNRLEKCQSIPASNLQLMPKLMK